MNKWIVVAAREGAQVIEQKYNAGPLLTIMNFRNPSFCRDGKRHSSVGSIYCTANNTGGELEKVESRTTADQLVEGFLKAFAKMLDDAINSRQVDKLVIVAELYMLEVLRDCLSKKAHAIVTEAVVKNRLFSEDCRQILAT